MADRADREPEWAVLARQWWPLAFPGIERRYRQDSGGVRGILIITIDTPHLQAGIEGRPVMLEPGWLLPDEFAALLRSVGEDSAISEESIANWERRLALMDPARDVAVFLMSSVADPTTGAFYTRFIVTHDGSAPIH